MSDCLFLIPHMDKQLIAEIHQPPSGDVAVHLRKACVRVVYHMMSLKFGTILVEPICNEHGDIVQPRISRCRTEKYPVIILRYLQERLCPWTAANETLLIKNKESVTDVLILVNIVPTVNR